MGLDTKTYWLTNRQSQSDFDLEMQRITTERVQRSIRTRMEHVLVICELDR
jgi:hypothetical protein